MRGVKAEFRELDYVFAHEQELTDPQWLRVIAASYSTAASKNCCAAEVARRRYRKRDHRFKICRELYISESQYYKLLNLFLQIAKKAEESN